MLAFSPAKLSWRVQARVHWSARDPQKNLSSKGERSSIFKNPALELIATLIGSQELAVINTSTSSLHSDIGCMGPPKQQFHPNYVTSFRDVQTNMETVSNGLRSGVYNQGRLPEESQTLGKERHDADSGRWMTSGKRSPRVWYVCSSVPQISHVLAASLAWSTPPSFLGPRLAKA